MTRVVIGLDPSLTHTAGFVAPHGGDLGETTSDSGFLARGAQNPEPRAFAIKSSPKDHAHPIARLKALRDAFVRELDAAAGMENFSIPGPPARVGVDLQHAPLLVIEGYAYGAKNGREALGELGGAFRLAAHERGWTVLVVPPSTLKQYVTGKGNSPKETVVLGVYKRWGYEAPDNNAADAYALMQLGLEWCAREAGEAVPKRITNLLAKLEPWVAGRLLVR